MARDFSSITFFQRTPNALLGRAQLSDFGQAEPEWGAA